MKSTQSNDNGPLERLRHIHEGMLSGEVIGTSLAAAAGAAAIVGTLGPLGIETSLGPGSRAAFGIVSCLLCWPPCHACSAALLNLMRHRSPREIVAAWALGVAFLALPCSATAYAVYRLFDIPGPLKRVFPPAYLCTVTLVLFCSSLVHLVAVCRLSPPTRDGERRRSTGREPAERVRNRQRADARKLPTGRLVLDRLPRGVGRDVVYMTVAGHYVKVVTSKGFWLIRMRFADAVAAMGETGIQLHRSYWVAFRHIVATLRRDDRMALRVTGSDELPVSRARKALVSAAIADRSSPSHASEDARLPFRNGSVTRVGNP